MDEFFRCFAGLLFADLEEITLRHAEFVGITREESQTSGRVIFIFLICIVFAYLVMVALYESLFIPLAVMLSVPFGLAGSLLFAKLFGTFGLLLTVPVLFAVFQKIQERVRKNKSDQ